VNEFGAMLQSLTRQKGDEPNHTEADGLALLASSVPLVNEVSHDEAGGPEEEEEERESNGSEGDPLPHGSSNAGSAAAEFRSVEVAADDGGIDGS